MGEKSLLQIECCDALVLQTGRCCTFRFPWTYGAAGRSTLPAEQINCKTPRRVEVKLLCTILTKLTIHSGTCQGQRAKA